MNASQLGQKLRATWTVGDWWRTSTEYCHGGDNPTDLVFRDGKDGRLVVYCHSRACQNWPCKCCKDNDEVTVAVTNSKTGSFAEDMREAGLSCFGVRLSNKDSIAQRMAETSKSFNAVMRRMLLTDVNNKIWLFNRKFGIPRYG